MLKAGIHIVAPQDPTAQPLSGKTFVFTGALECFSRSEANKQVEALGAHASSSVTGKTDYVVAGKAPGQKLDDANEQGVKTLDEAEFLALLREAGGEA